jgi:hypothetical protein
MAAAVVVANVHAGTITSLTQIPGSAFGQYGVIVGGYGGATHNTQFSSSENFNTSVALGSPLSLQGGNVTIHGNLDFAGTASGTGSLSVTGTTTANSATAAQAVADAISLASMYGAVTSLPTFSAASLNVITGGASAACGAQGCSYNGDTHQHVYAADTSWNGAVSITAAASEYVIFDVGAGSSSTWSLGAVLLSGGIAYDHVLINVLTGGQLSSSNAHNQSVNAIVIDNSGKTVVDNFTLNGRIFCTTASADCQIVSGADVNSSASPGSVPEPATPALISGGLLLLGLRRLRKRLF